MAETREIFEFPINILQEMISVLLVNKDDFEGEGKINDYFLLKKDNFATVIYDDTKVSYIANFVGDKENNWFFVGDIIVDQSLTSKITNEDIDTFKELFEELAEKAAKEHPALLSKEVELEKENVEDHKEEKGERPAILSINKDDED